MGLSRRPFRWTLVLWIKSSDDDANGSVEIIEIFCGPVQRCLSSALKAVQLIG